MKVAIIGAGAVGLNYGLRLLQVELLLLDNCPTNVFFLLRRDYTRISRSGVLHQVESEVHRYPAAAMAGRVFSTAESLRQTAGCMDVLLICTKSYSLDAPDLFDSLSTLSHDQTRYLIIMNGLGIEERFCETLKCPERIYGAVTYIAANRVYPHQETQEDEQAPVTVVVVKDHRLEIGHMLDEPAALQQMLDLWSHTQIAALVVTVPSLLATRW